MFNKRLVVLVLLALFVVFSTAGFAPALQGGDVSPLIDVLEEIFAFFPAAGIASAALVFTTLVEIGKKLGWIADGYGGIVFGGLNAALVVVLAIARAFGAVEVVEAIFNALAALLPVLGPILVAILTGSVSWRILRAADAPLFRK